VTQLNSELKDSEDMIQSLTVLFESSQYTKRYEAPRELGEFWQIAGRKNLFDKISEILPDSGKSVNYYTGMSSDRDSQPVGNTNRLLRAGGY